MNFKLTSRSEYDYACTVCFLFVLAVHEASTQLMKSKRLQKLLQIVLALGNYMNRGQRGNAKGFTVNSLNNMVDTKSSINKQITLLHYLVDTVEKKVKVYLFLIDFKLHLCQVHSY